MARAQMGFSEVLAFSTYCKENNLKVGDPDSLKAWKASLKPKDGSGSGQRGRIKGAMTRAFIYAEGGKLLATVDCLDNDAGRMGVGAAALQTHGVGVVREIAFTRGFAPGGSPKLVDSVNPETGESLRGYSIGRRINCLTGEETSGESAETSEDSDEIESE